MVVLSGTFRYFHIPGTGTFRYLPTPIRDTVKKGRYTLNWTATRFLICYWQSPDFLFFISGSCFYLTWLLNCILIFVFWVRRGMDNRELPVIISVWMVVEFTVLFSFSWKAIVCCLCLWFVLVNVNKIYFLKSINDLRKSSTCIELKIIHKPQNLIPKPYSLLFKRNHCHSRYWTSQRHLRRTNQSR